MDYCELNYQVRFRIEAEFSSNKGSLNKFHCVRSIRDKLLCEVLYHTFAS
jgi:hypothetical protein